MTMGRAASAAVFLLLVGAAGSQAATPAFGIGVTPARLEWKLPPGTREIHSEVTVFNRSSNPVDAQISLQDVAISRSGAWQVLPASSTPYSFPATFAPDHFSLARGGSIKIKISAAIKSLRPLFGGALIHPIPVASSGASGSGLGVQVNPDLLVPLIAAPIGSDGTVEGVELSGQGAGLEAPMLIEHGPIPVAVSARNTSNFYERSFTTVEYSFFGHTYLTVDQPPIGTFPGTVARSQSSSIVQVAGAGDLDPTPWIGLVHVTATTHMTLIDSSAPEIVQDRWIVIIPYRAALVILGLLVALVAVRRWRNALHS